MKPRPSARDPLRLSDLGEDALLARLLPQLPSNRSVVVGAGDDCAVVKLPGTAQRLLLKTDCVVEGVHFTMEADARAVGWKAMARPLSDFAAMAVRPQFALVTLIAPPATQAEWIAKLYQGLGKAARAFNVAIVGGETSSTSGPLAIAVSVTGVAGEKWITRSGGKAGDWLFVTGKLGGSQSGRHLRFVPRIQEALWLTRHFPVHAMMDLSDGLGADLPRLAAASRLGFEVREAAIPRSRGCTVAQAISDGEDYELLFAVSPNDSAKLERAWAKKFPKVPLTCIGRLIRKSKTANRELPAGYAHFQ